MFHRRRGFGLGEAGFVLDLFKNGMLESPPITDALC